MSTEEVMMADADEKKEEVTDISDSKVMTKYNSAATIANQALDAAMKLCVDGAVIAEVCAASDAVINEKCGAIYNKGKEKISKGVGFPTCVSVNNLVGHVSPLVGFLLFHTLRVT